MVGTGSSTKEQSARLMPQTRESIDKNSLPALSPKRKLEPMTPSDTSKSTQRKMEELRVNNNTADVPGNENQFNFSYVKIALK